MAQRRKKTRPEILAATLCAVAQLLPQAAAAEASPPERETARALMAEGDRLRAEGDLRGALTRYQAAHALVHVPTTGLDVARVQAQLGLLVEARSTATEVMHDPPVPSEPKVFAQARTQAVALVNELEGRVPALQPEVQPQRATFVVSVDGVTLPSEIQGLPYRVNPGLHSLRVEAAGYETEIRQLTVTDGEIRSVPISLKPRIVTDASAQTATSDVGSPRVSAHEDASSAANAARLRGIIGLSTGGAALVFGSVTGLMAISQGSSIRRECQGSACDVSQRGPLSTANTLANVANISLPIGLVAIGYGLYELLMPGSEPQSNEHARGVRLELTGLSATLRGSL